jgi:hypothetical protein
MSFASPDPGGVAKLEKLGVFKKDIRFASVHATGGTEKPPMLYVLGAAQGRLGHHLELASLLYLRGLARTIYILDRPGITETAIRN